MRTTTTMPQHTATIHVGRDVSEASFSVALLRLDGRYDGRLDGRLDEEHIPALQRRRGRLPRSAAAPVSTEHGWLGHDWCRSLGHDWLQVAGPRLVQVAGPRLAAWPGIAPLPHGGGAPG